MKPPRGEEKKRITRRLHKGALSALYALALESLFHRLWYQVPRREGVCIRRDPSSSGEFLFNTRSIQNHDII